MIRAIVTDIEGTTSSISFVKDVLFPYAKQHLADYVHAHAAEPYVRHILDEVASVEQHTLTDEQAIITLLGWIDQDKKIAPLKNLQGLIWEHGYRNGDFYGHVYPDAHEQLEAWHAEGLTLAIFSSGSVYAQQLLFKHTEYGDLTSLFSDYFDTRIGMKQEQLAYEAICKKIGFAPNEILFLSDIATELDAASSYGMATYQLVREGTEPCERHPQATSFFEIKINTKGSEISTCC
jgi:enolase-phosphatase E1